MENIIFESEELSKFYSENRHSWDDFYESEKRMLSMVMDQQSRECCVLDVGCACGGLAEALNERYQLSYYRGVDINKQCIDIAKARKADLPFTTEYTFEDIVKSKDQRVYNVVVSLGAADCNVDYDGIVQACWNRVAEDGYLVLSGRFTNDSSLYDTEISYQNICEKDDEIASYVVMNFTEWVDKVKKMDCVSEVEGYGYYGKPASTVHTIYDEVCFGTMVLHKSVGGGIKRLKLDMPLELLSSPPKKY